jgi:ABC-2 type transport system permease protein
MSSTTETPPQEQSAIAVRRHGNHNTWRNVRLIIVREYKNVVMQRSFVITTIIILLLSFIGTSVPTVIQYFTSRSNDQTKIVLVNNAGTIAGMNTDELVKYYDRALNGDPTATMPDNTNGKPRFAISTSADGLESLKKQVQEGQLSLLLTFERNGQQNLQATAYSSHDDNPSSADSSTAAQLQQITNQLNQVDKAARLGLTPEQSQSLFTPMAITSVNLQQNKGRTTSEWLTGYLLGLAGVVLIFMSTFMYGVMVARGVAEEKGTRIMEILINAATPFQLMTGKIIGIGMAGLTQMSALVVVTLIGLQLQAPLRTLLLGSSTGGLPLDISGASTTLILLVLLYFILGYLLYSSLFAAVGALVSRQDDVQNATAPLTWIFMVGYLASFFAAATPDAPWAKVMSYIPFWTPTMMVMRVGIGAVAWWEIVMSMGLIAVTALLCTWLAARIYRYGVLMYGQKPALRQIIKLIRG